jgi:hypothetical protein
MTVVAVATHDHVVIPQRGDCTHGHGLLSDVQVAKPPDLAQGVRLTRPLLKPADQANLTQQMAVEIRLLGI